MPGPLEHAISKLLSSGLQEENELGAEVREQARNITPTLIKYAERNEYLAGAAARLSEMESIRAETSSPLSTAGGDAGPQVRLVNWEPEAEDKLVAALLYAGSHRPYEEIRSAAGELGPEERKAIISRALEGMGPHDAPPREFEAVDYTFEYLMDYGAYREFKRHRMQSYFPQQATVAHGYRVPPVVRDGGMADVFDEAIGQAEAAFRKVSEFSPLVAQYLVTHAHNRRLLSKLNLRECYHLFKLRTSTMAHASIREPVKEAMRLAAEVHPRLFDHLQLRG